MPNFLRLLSLSLALAASCAGPRAEPEPPPPAAVAAPAPEVGAEHRLNEHFLSDDLDVQQFVQTFEGESREIAVHHLELTAALGLQAGMAVADVGAGTGLFLEPLARAVGPSGRVYALDIAPRFVEHLAQRAEQGGFVQVEARLCTETSVGLPASSIDLALVCDTYHHFEHPQATLASLRTALRPGGRLLVVDLERIPGVSREWTLDHVRGDKQVFRSEIEAAGFRFEGEIEVPGMVENYVLQFRRP